ncbi:outer membrane beta-barrel protein [uncultured Algimonas sp.]|uniref:outer membrane beta-barrel protein n=1 Tax=uncultured Algimonas sp. TaxID=1547920 RepID=UPI00262B6440|nr:outer membrane beta-barrel protein [uncultured Algimonas sp.]
MKLSAAIMTASAIALMGGTAMAQDSNVYINAGVDSYEFDSYTLSGKIGYNFNEYFGVEGQGAFGIGGDEDAAFDQIVQGSRIQGSLSAEVDNSFAAFARVKLPINERFEVFARGGYHFTQVGFETSAFTVTTAGTPRTIAATEDNIDFDGFAAGVGAQFMFNPLNGVRVEYTFQDVENVEDVSVDGTDFGEFGSDVYSISYVRKF